ncbi:MAG: DUF86 domain-containing protein [Methanomassiliicoccaceae archaeon]|nr:DUF86 domain-containing protein [Methanomassiliicoccaceae archaeon]
MKDDKRLLKIIVDYCIDIEECRKYFGNDEQEFRSNQFFQRCCAFDVFQIGETVKALSNGLRNSHPNVQWRKIAGFRDIIAHKYGEVDTEDLWIAITIEVPELKESCESILADINSD